MKTITDWAERISAGIGVLLIAIALIQKVMGKEIIFKDNISYFHSANTFFLITIVLYLHHFRHLKD